MVTLKPHIYKGFLSLPNGFRDRSVFSGDFRYSSVVRYIESSRKGRKMEEDERTYEEWLSSPDSPLRVEQAECEHEYPSGFGLRMRLGLKLACVRCGAVSD